MNLETTTLHFEKILERQLARNQKRIEVIGTDSTLALSLFLSQMQASSVAKQPHLIILPTSKEVESFEAHLRFFDPETPVSVLPSFDVSPFSGLYPNTRAVSGRVRWLHEAQKADPRRLFVASIEAVMQKTLPVACLDENTHELKVNDELPDKFSERLTQLGFQSVPLVEDEGTFAVRGGIIDIFSPAHPLPVRVELFGDTIESRGGFFKGTKK